MSKEDYPVEVKDVGENGFHDAAPKTVETKPWWKLGGEDFSFVSVNAGYPTSSTSATSSKTELDVDDPAGHNVWTNEDSKELYKPIEGYEGAHRFDPSLTWTEEEEKRLVTQLDWRIALPACTMFFALQLDRGNITQAISDTMLSKYMFSLGSSNMNS
jgi:hypothetical protein